MKWRVVVSNKLSPAANMAIDEAVFEEVINGNSLPTIRFYDWDPAAVSIGYNQTADDEVLLCIFFVQRKELLYLKIH